MGDLIITVALGLVLLIIGISNLRGNINTMHSYHRKRVTPENVKPFGKLVGIGTIMISVSIIVLAVLMFIFEKTQNNVYLVIGVVQTITLFVIGMGLNFYAMIKYNKGIF